MKNIYAFLILLTMVTAGMAQTDVTLEINHKLGSSPFQFNAPAMNNNNVEFNVSRLQYYISKIILVHDGGQETVVPNTWILVNANTTTQQLLGNFSFTTLEGIKMGIGVESAVNHLDPSTYPASHPLAPKSPSMHWGWSAGYRFVAMEGRSGANFSQIYQIHALEDAYYFQTSITTAGISGSNGMTIALNADYEMALKNIDVSTGPITHGGFGEAITLLQNFRDDVFSASTTVGLEKEINNSVEMGIAPNPAAASGQFRVFGNFGKEATILVSDLSGRIVREIPAAVSGMTVALSNPGFYFISLKENGSIVATTKLMVVQ